VQAIILVARAQGPYDPSGVN